MNPIPEIIGIPRHLGGKNIENQLAFKMNLNLQLQYKRMVTVISVSLASTVFQPPASNARYTGITQKDNHLND